MKGVNPLHSLLGAGHYQVESVVVDPVWQLLL